MRLGGLPSLSTTYLHQNHMTTMLTITKLTSEAQVSLEASSDWALKARAMATIMVESSRTSMFAVSLDSLLRAFTPSLEACLV